MASGISRKRPRSSMSEQPCFRLEELFGSRQEEEDSQNTCCKVPFRDSLKESSFCTFRMEQRSGGNLATHPGEERILIFCSNQRGAIAKIVFSSETTSEKMGNSVNAKIHSLSVKEPFRGYGLGSFLFFQAMSSLIDQYLSAPLNASDYNLPHVECSLEAEEDIRRHHKLVHFYESCGCHVKPNAKITYINNNDGETYRKVPMHIILMPQPSQSLPSNRAWNNFLPVDFFSAHHQRAQLSTDSNPLDWFVVEIDENTFEFRSTDGRLLSVGNDGYCKIVDGSSTPSSQFVFQHATDTTTAKPNVSYRSGSIRKSCNPGSRDLCTIKSKSGHYLGIDPVHTRFTCSEDPSFWHTGDYERSLVCVKDSPARREHCAHLWTVQTIDYVLQKRERYLRFNLGRLSLKDALELAGSVKANGFGEERCDRSLRSLLYTTAEQSRLAGFPDWFQLIALIHGLAAVLGLMEPDVSKEATEEGYDWTLCSQSGFIGANDRLSRVLYPSRIGDTSVTKSYSTKEIRTNLDHPAMLPLWTGPEYLYSMLKHNGVELPEEAFVVLRLFAIDDSEREEYSKNMAEFVDYDALCFVQDFCDILETARQVVFSTDERHEKGCSSLWNVHFSRIFEKYGADKVLQW